MTKFYLIRHGNTNAGNILSGRTSGFHLSQNGIEQASGIASNMSSVKLNRIFCSPMERTQETANPLCNQLQLDFIVNEAFHEVDFGEWTGKSFDELENDKRWKLFHTFRSATRIPGGESMPEVQTRMIFGMEKIREEFPEESIAIFSHGDPIRTALVYYAGMPLDFMLRLIIDTGSISALLVNKWGVQIHYLNFTGKAG